MKFTINANGFQTILEYGELRISSQENGGFRPYQLLVSSIAGCSGGVLRNILQKMRLPFNDIGISAQVKRNQEKANRIEEIHLIFTIYAENIAPNKIEKALELTRKNCAMIQSVKDSIKITEEFDLRKTHSS
ncbi:OsmC family protein [Virgibacillus sp. FSP13]